MGWIFPAVGKNEKFLEFIIDFTARFGILLMMPSLRYVAAPCRAAARAVLTRAGREVCGRAYEALYIGQNEVADV